MRSFSLLCLSLAWPMKRLCLSFEYQVLLCWFFAFLLYFCSMVVEKHQGNFLFSHHFSIYFITESWLHLESWISSSYEPFLRLVWLPIRLFAMSLTKDLSKHLSFLWAPTFFHQLSQKWEHLDQYAHSLRQSLWK